jgi:transposase-like protein
MVAAERIRRGGAMAEKGLPYGNGCENHADCFNCPEPDCTAGEDETSRRSSPTLRGQGTLATDNGESKPHLCKYCGGSHVSRYGTVKGVRRYFCRDCKRKFTSKDSLFHMKVPRLLVETAQSLWADNLLYREIAQYLEERYGYSPSLSSIHRWVRRIQPNGRMY